MAKITNFAIRVDKRFMFVDDSYDIAIKRAVKLNFLKDPDFEVARVELGFCTQSDEFIPRHSVDASTLDMAIAQA